MPPVPQTPPAQSLGSQFVPVKSNSKEVDASQQPTPLNANEDASLGKDEPPLRLVPVSNISPSPSVFGEHDTEEYGLAAELPENIQRYLDDHNWEAHYVVADGNCLYRALTYGPESKKHGLARDATASYLDGLVQTNNVLGTMVTKDEIEEIRTDKYWANKETGELQLKAAAEAMNINIDFVDGDRLENDLGSSADETLEEDKLEMKRFGPTPILIDGEAEPVESRFGPDKARTVFLWKEHYYPLLPKGAFPNLRKISKQHHVGAQVSSPPRRKLHHHLEAQDSLSPLSSNSETQTHDEGGVKIANVLDKITMHQDSIAESLLKGKKKALSQPLEPLSQPNNPLSQPLHDTPTMKGVRPGKEHWDPHHNSPVLYTGKTVPRLEELPPQPIQNGGQKDVISPVERIGLNGWVAFSLGAVVTTLMAVAGAVGWKFWKRPAVKARNEMKSRDVNYYSDDGEFDIRAKW